ncbi:TrkH family potassium uptake protein [Mycoplasma sp. Ms02]|uniref:TrkH family potassium uptake protein n=1 Tax=Mycoplasma sp. Ms02 TaxID=353851 RepID=UPI001C89C0D5|nr:potassium transporter TrkG [Mycoplasma sp. Ms02]QZE12365.1 TrkH family potassium uptake protein [Mycoplasma sp. Ms02]
MNNRKIPLSKSIKDIDWSVFNPKNYFTRLRYILLVYTMLIVVAILLLWSPWTQNLAYEDAQEITFIQAVFTSVSAFSDTGLVVKDTYIHWNIFGQAVIATLIFIGGLGFFALKVFLFHTIFRKKYTSLSEINLINSERGGQDISRTISLVISSIKFLIVMILISGLGLTLYFYLVEPQTTDWMKKDIGHFINPKGDIIMSLRFGFFHAISAINNAGFDIISGNSLMPYYQNYGLQIIFIILLIIGGLGYPVIFDIKNWIKWKLKRKQGKYLFSMFTKISLITYLIVFIVGLASVWIFEFFVSPKDFSSIMYRGKSMTVGSEGFADGSYYGSLSDKIMAIVFSVFSTRSAGFTTVDMSNFQQGTILMMVTLMFIGAAPASTGGGIRTTTFAIVILSLFAKMTGRPKIRLFWKSINKETESRALTVFAISIILLVVISAIVASSFDTHYGLIASGKANENHDYGIIHVLFEVTSAFGTTGLSTGITKSLNNASLIAIIVTMFIGQFGISSTILVWGKKRNYSNRYEYIETDVTIG